MDHTYRRKYVHAAMIKKTLNDKEGAEAVRTYGIRLTSLIIEMLGRGAGPSGSERFGWGGWTRTNTVLINSEVPYQLDHAPAVSQRPVESYKDKHCTQNAQARGERFYSVVSVGKPTSLQERQPPSMEMQFV